MLIDSVIAGLANRPHIAGLIRGCPPPVITLAGLCLRLAATLVEHHQRQQAETQQGD